jgi:hypothetical protein
MRWLTKKQVLAAARKGEYAAAEYSRKHWQQLTTAKAKELRDAYSKNSNLIGGSYCALCCFFNNDCHRCKLYYGDWTSCCLEYKKAVKAFDEWRNKGYGIKNFCKAGKELIKRIEEKFNLEG